MSHPLDEQLAELVRHHQIRTVPPLRCEVLSQSGSELELRVLLRQDLRELWGLDAGLQGVPLAPAGGWQLKLAPGAQVRVDFLGGDFSDPLATYLSGDVLEATLATPAVNLGSSGATVKLAGGANPVVRMDDAITGLANGAGAVTGSVAVTAPGKVLA